MPKAPHPQTRGNARPGLRTHLFRLLRITAWAVLALCVLTVAAVLVVRTDPVAEILRGFLEKAAESRLNATVTIAKLEGSVLTDITLEGIRMADPDLETVLTIRRVSAAYLLPALLRKRLHVQRLAVEGLRLHLRHAPETGWNLSHLIKSRTAAQEPASPLSLPLKLVVARFDLDDISAAITGPAASAPRNVSIRRMRAHLSWDEEIRLRLHDLVVNARPTVPLALTAKGAARFDPATGQAALTALTVCAGNAAMVIHGNVRLGAAPQPFHMSAHFRNVDPAAFAPQHHCRKPLPLLSGELTARGTTAAFEHRLIVHLPDGRVALTGQSGISPDLGVHTATDVVLKNIDPTRLCLRAENFLGGPLNGSVSVTGTRLRQPDAASGQMTMVLVKPAVRGIALDRISAEATWSDGTLSIDHFDITAGKNRMALSGAFCADTSRTALDLSLHVADLGRLYQGITPHLPTSAPAAPLAGRLDLRATLRGRWQNPDIQVTADGHGIGCNAVTAERLHLSATAAGMPGKDNTRLKASLTTETLHLPGGNIGSLSAVAAWDGAWDTGTGDIDVTAEVVQVSGQRFTTASMTASVAPAAISTTVSTIHENGSTFSLAGKIDLWKGPVRKVTIHQATGHLHAPWPAAALSLAAPVRITLAPEHIDIQDARLRLNDALVTARGTIAPGGAQDVHLHVTQLDTSSLPAKWTPRWLPVGNVSADLDFLGTLESPTISARLTIKDLRGTPLPDTAQLSAAIDYCESRLSFQADLARPHATLLTAGGTVPLRLGFRPFSLRLLNAPCTVDIETRGLNLSELPVAQGKSVAWDAVTDIRLALSGRLPHPEAHGTIVLREGWLRLTENNLTYEAITANLELSGDTLTVRDLMIQGDREGVLRGRGRVVFASVRHPVFDLSLTGNHLLIPFQQALTVRVSPRLSLKGPLDAPVLTGQVVIDEGRLDMDRLSVQRPTEIRVITPGTQDADKPIVIADSQQPGLFAPLTADIRVLAPNNAWLKGQDLSAEIAGDIRVVKHPQGDFLLLGDLKAVRGNYFFMGKNFSIQKGTVTFLGLRELDPALDLQAETRIRSATIIVTVNGTAREPVLHLGSEPTMSESDIISLLVFGKPADNLTGGQAFNVQEAALSYTGGLLASELRQLLGGVAFIDTVAVASGSGDNGLGAVTLGKYITPKVFLAHRQGLSETERSYAEITYQLTPRFKIETQVGRENTGSVDMTWEIEF